MGKSDLDAIFAEFAARYRAGTAPDAMDYLERAGERADELADMIRLFLTTASLPDATPATEARARARVEHPARTPAFADVLADARERQGLKKADVGRRLADALGLPAEASRVKGYYADLENGNLDPRRLNERVIAALGDVLKAPMGWLEAARRPEWILPAAPAAPGFGRATADADARPVPPPVRRRRDELDELFLGPA
jgi:transcriptional regulator with XRE-family HTH domain